MSNLNKSKEVYLREYKKETLKQYPRLNKDNWNLINLVLDDFVKQLEKQGLDIKKVVENDN